MNAKEMIFGSIFLVSSASMTLTPHELCAHPNSIEKDLHYRDYYAQVTDTEMKDMRFILKTLAQKSLLSLWGYQTKLEEAGDRIDHIHPLRFLHSIFSNDEFIVYINNIEDRGGWVRDGFIDGFKQSFDEESDRNNLREEFLEDFSATFDLKFSTIRGKAKNRDWEGLIKHLVINIKREGDSGKYDQ